MKNNLPNEVIPQNLVVIVILQILLQVLRSNSYF